MCHPPIIDDANPILRLGIPVDEPFEFIQAQLRQHVRARSGSGCLFRPPVAVVPFLAAVAQGAHPTLYATSHRLWRLVAVHAPAPGTLAHCAPNWYGPKRERTRTLLAAQMATDEHL